MSFFSDFGRRLMEARAREARRRVNDILLSMDDKSLSQLGYERAELRRKGSNGAF